LQRQRQKQHGYLPADEGKTVWMIGWKVHQYALAVRDSASRRRLAV
jgi:hypothetical protein